MSTLTNYKPTPALQRLLNCEAVELFDPDHPTERDPAPWVRVNWARFNRITDEERAIAEQVLRSIDEASLQLGKSFDPWAVAERILALHGLKAEPNVAMALARLHFAPISLQRFEQIGEREKSRLQQRKWNLATELHARCTRHFGEGNGWRLCARPFAVSQLRDRKRSASDRAWWEPFPLIDHPYWYRSVENGRAAGAAALAFHSYALKPGGDNSRLVAEYAALGLRATFPDYPSWWFPGMTTLVLVTPRDEKDGAA